jgi:hypothetical protein
MNTESEIHDWLATTALGSKMDILRFVQQAQTVSKPGLLVKIYLEGNESEKVKALAAIRARGEQLTLNPTGGVQYRGQGTHDGSIFADPAKITYDFLIRDIETSDSDGSDTGRVNCGRRRHNADLLQYPKASLGDFFRKNRR